jgi:hypothetical protein
VSPCGDILPVPGIPDKPTGAGPAGSCGIVEVDELVLRETTVRLRDALAHPVLRVAVGVAAVLLIPATATVAGGADWSVGDFVLAAVLLAVIGAGVELAVRNAGNIATSAGIAALGVAAAALGEAEDAPGLVLLGLLLLATAAVLAARILRRTR